MLAIRFIIKYQWFQEQKQKRLNITNNDSKVQIFHMLHREIRRRQQLITIQQALKTRQSLTKSQNKQSQQKSQTRQSPAQSTQLRNRASITENCFIRNRPCSRYLKNANTKQVKINEQKLKRKQGPQKRQYYNIKTVGSQNIMSQYSHLSVFLNSSSFAGHALNNKQEKSSAQIDTNPDKSTVKQNIGLQEDQIRDRNNDLKKKIKNKKITFYSMVSNKLTNQIKPENQDLSEISYNADYQYNTNKLHEDNFVSQQAKMIKQKPIGSSKKQYNIQELEVQEEQLNSISNVYNQQQQSSNNININKKMHNQKISSVNLPRSSTSNYDKKQCPIMESNAQLESMLFNHCSDDEINSQVIVSNKVLMKRLANSNQSDNKNQIKQQMICSKTFKTFKTLKTLKTLKSMETFKSLGVNNIVPEEDTGSLQYKLISQIGQGGFSTVWKVKPFHYQGFIAVKKIPSCSKNSIQEIKIMKELSGHPYIVEFYFANIVQKKSGDSLQILMQYFQDGTLQNKIKMEGTLDFNRIRIYSFQIFRALHYFHHKGICHRDVKSSNILLKGNRIAISDMGSAKKLDAFDTSQSFFCSKSNKAPELILNSSDYDYKVDIWAAGCIMVQMILGRPLFQSYNSEDLLIEIIKYRSTPSHLQLQSMGGDASLRIKNWKLPTKVNKKRWSEILQEQYLDKNLEDLLQSIFSYNPKKRPKAINILSHRYFDIFKDQKKYKRNCHEYDLQDQFYTFLPDQVNDDVRNMVPAWIKIDEMDS